MPLSKIDADGVTGLQETLTATTTVPSEGGAVTTNVVQGLAKAWTRFDATTNTEIDSLNQTSRTDIGSGVSQLNFANNMNNDDFASCCQPSQTGRPINASTGAYHSSTNSETTALVEMVYGYSSNGIVWTVNDYNNVKTIVHGDLA